MPPKKSIIILFLTLIAFGCAEPKEQGSHPSTDFPPTDTIVSVDDSVALVDSIALAMPANTDVGAVALPGVHGDTAATPPLLDVSDWKADDFIVSCPDFLLDEFRGDMEYYQEEWSGLESPLLATFRGNEIGDYFHLNFEGENGRIYDFGRAFQVNDFGEYVLYEGKSYEDNKRLLNRNFKIHWEWKVSGYPCCSGLYELVEAYVPTITRLELVEGK